MAIEMEEVCHLLTKEHKVENNLEKGKFSLVLGLVEGTGCSCLSFSINYFREF